MGEMSDYSDVVLDSDGYYVSTLDLGQTIEPGQYIKAATDHTIELLMNRKARILRSGQVVGADLI